MHDDELDRELQRLFTDDRLALPVAADAERQVRAGIARRRRRRSAALAVAGALLATGAVFAAAAIGPGAVSDRAEPPPANPSLSTAPSSTATPPGTSNRGRPATPSHTGAPTASTHPQPPPGQPGGENPPPGTSRPTDTPTPPRYRVVSAVLGPYGIGPLRLRMSEREAVATGALGARSSRGACASYPVNGPGVTTEISPRAGLTTFVASRGARTPEGVTIGTARQVVVQRYSVRESRRVAVDTITVDAPGNPDASYVFSFDAANRVGSFVLRLKAGAC